MQTRTKSLMSGSLFLAICLPHPLPASATPISVSQVYNYLDNRGPSNTGITSFDGITFGALNVLPNGAAGTTGTASNADYMAGAALNLVFQSQIIGSNEFAARVPVAAAPTSPWTLTFRNGGDQTQVTTPGVAGAPSIGFARNVSIAGTTTPTIAWAPAAGDTVNGTRLNFYNLDQRVNGLATLFNTVNLSTASQFTIPSSWGLQAGTNYSVEISLIHTRDGSGNLANSNLLSRSRSFFDFQLLSQPVAGPVFLPTVVPGTGTTPYVFNFNITGVSNTQTTFIDPVVAIGYDYKVGAGDPNFASVLLPQMGDGIYQLYTRSAGAWVLVGDVAAEQRVDLGAGGASEFRIAGIETDVGLDPADGTAFVTGLTFTGSGNFTGTMTPLTVTVVPEPAAWSLLFAGLCGVAAAVRRRGGARRRSARHRGACTA